MIIVVMILMLKLEFLLTLILSIKLIGALKNSGSFTYNDDLVRVFWEIDNDNITIGIKCKTKGWVGIGFSRNGAMTGADLVIGWVDDKGNAFYQDYNGYDNAKPNIDKRNDYDLLNGQQNDTYTELTYRRKLLTCDDEDYQITEDSVKIIFAWGDNDPDDFDNVPYHGPEHRAAKSVLLLSEKETYSLPEDLVYWNVMVKDVKIPTNKTTYWCVPKKLPEFAQNDQHYYIGREPVIAVGLQNYVHHITLHICKNNESLYGPKIDIGYDCSDADTMNCQTYQAAWAAGGELELLPPNVGVTLGGNFGHTDYFILQVHYNNPTQLDGLVDNSGFKMYLTKTKREFESSTIYWLAMPNIAMIIPPNKLPGLESGFVVNSILSSECTKNSFPEGGINIFIAGLHGHLAATQIRIRHVRNGIELKPIAFDQNYDFNYQEGHKVKPSVKVLPGDDLIVECVMKNKHDRPILAGLQTSDEMCFGYIEYYPRSNLSRSIDRLLEHDLKPFFENPGNKSLHDLIATYDFSRFSPEKMKDFQKLSQYGDRSGYCIGENAVIPYNIKFPDITVPYRVKDPCKKC